MQGVCGTQGLARNWAGGVVSTAAAFDHILQVLRRRMRCRMMSPDLTYLCRARVHVFPCKCSLPWVSHHPAHWHRVICWSSIPRAEKDDELARSRKPLANCAGHHHADDNQSGSSLGWPKRSANDHVLCDAASALLCHEDSRFSDAHRRFCLEAQSRASRDSLKMMLMPLYCFFWVLKMTSQAQVSRADQSCTGLFLDVWTLCTADKRSSRAGPLPQHTARIPHPCSQLMRLGQVPAVFTISSNMQGSCNFIQRILIFTCALLMMPVDMQAAPRRAQQTWQS